MTSLLIGGACLVGFVLLYRGYIKSNKSQTESLQRPVGFTGLPWSYMHVTSNPTAQGNAQMTMSVQSRSPTADFFRQLEKERVYRYTDPKTGYVWKRGIDASGTAHKWWCEATNETVLT